MASRIDKLLNAYFNQPLKEYAQVVAEIKNSGGLTSEEIGALQTKLLYVDAHMIVRQAGATATHSIASPST